MTYYVTSGQTVNVTAYSSDRPYYDPFHQPGSYFDTVESGGVENVLGGGQTYFATINMGGVENVLAAGRANNTIVNYGGVINVGGDTLWGPGAVAVGTVVTWGGFEFVRSNGVSFGAYIHGGVNSVQYAGTAESSSVTGLSGFVKGYEVVSSGGVSNDAYVGQFGDERVGQGGTVNRATVDNGGFLHLLMGVSNGASVLAGGELDNYGTANSTILSGLEQVFAGGRENGVRINAGGVDNVYSGGVVNNAVLNGGTLDIFAGGAATGVTNFANGADSHLILEDSAHFTGQLQGFNLGDRIDLQDIGYGHDTFSFSGTATSGTLTVSDGVHQASLTLLGDYRGVGLSDTGNGGEIFFASSDGHGGTLIGIGVTGITATAPLGSDQPVFR